MAGCPSGLRERIANPFFVGSNPTPACEHFPQQKRCFPLFYAGFVLSPRLLSNGKPAAGKGSRVDETRKRSSAGGGHRSNVPRHPEPRGGSIRSGSIRSGETGADGLDLQHGQGIAGRFAPEAGEQRAPCWPPQRGRPTALVLSDRTGAHLPWRLASRTR